MDIEPEQNDDAAEQYEIENLRVDRSDDILEKDGLRHRVWKYIANSKYARKVRGKEKNK